VKDLDFTAIRRWLFVGALVVCGGVMIKLAMPASDATPTPAMVEESHGYVSLPPVSWSLADGHEVTIRVTFEIAEDDRYAVRRLLPRIHERVLQQCLLDGGEEQDFRRAAFLEPLRNHLLSRVQEAIAPLPAHNIFFESILIK
jgi:hypothetical protein